MDVNLKAVLFVSQVHVCSIAVLPLLLIGIVTVPHWYSHIPINNKGTCIMYNSLHIQYM